MSMNLPPIIQKYIDASNAPDVESILACFADDAVVRDENETRRGRTKSNIGSRRRSRNTISNSSRWAHMNATTRLSSASRYPEHFPEARFPSITTSPSGAAKSRL
jgi:hypothetical protein